MRIAVAVLMCVITPALVLAQEQTVLPSNDVIIAVGWAGSEYKIQDDERWRKSLFLGLSGGHYWTNHLKTELEAVWQTRSRSETYADYYSAVGSTYALSDVRVDEIRFGIAQMYQFGRNEWFHPFLGIGANVVWQDTSSDRREQAHPAYSAARSAVVTVMIPAAHERERRTFVQPFLKTGLKMYVSDKSFLTTELKTGFRGDLEFVVWKFGLGVDF